MEDNDIALRKHNLQYSYFEDKSYDYLTIIHKTEEKEQIHTMMKKINLKICEYVEATD